MSSSTREGRKGADSGPKRSHRAHRSRSSHVDSRDTLQSDGTAVPREVKHQRSRREEPTSRPPISKSAFAMFAGLQLRPAPESRPRRTSSTNRSSTGTTGTRGTSRDGRQRDGDRERDRERDRDRDRSREPGQHRSKTRDSSTTLRDSEPSSSRLRSSAGSDQQQQPPGLLSDLQASRGRQRSTKSGTTTASHRHIQEQFMILQAISREFVRASDLVDAITQTRGHRQRAIASRLKYIQLLDGGPKPLIPTDLSLRDEYEDDNEEDHRISQRCERARADVVADRDAHLHALRKVLTVGYTAPGSSTRVMSMPADRGTASYLADAEEPPCLTAEDLERRCDDLAQERKEYAECLYGDAHALEGEQPGTVDWERVEGDCRSFWASIDVRVKRERALHAMLISAEWAHGFQQGDNDWDPDRAMLPPQEASRDTATADSGASAQPAASPMVLWQDPDTYMWYDGASDESARWIKAKLGIKARRDRLFSSAALNTPMIDAPGPSAPTRDENMAETEAATMSRDASDAHLVGQDQGEGSDEGNLALISASDAQPAFPWRSQETDIMAYIRECNRAAAANK